MWHKGRQAGYERVIVSNRTSLAGRRQGRQAFSNLFYTKDTSARVRHQDMHASNLYPHIEDILRSPTLPLHQCMLSADRHKVKQASNLQGGFAHDLKRGLTYNLIQPNC